MKNTILLILMLFLYGACFGQVHTNKVTNPYINPATVSGHTTSIATLTTQIQSTAAEVTANYNDLKSTSAALTTLSAQFASTSGAVGFITGNTTVGYYCYNGTSQTIQTPAGGGGSSAVALGKHVTGYFVLVAGDSFLADSEFMAIKDNYIQVPTTWTILNITPFCVYTSTVWATTYNLACSTETGNVTVWSKIDTTGFSVPVNVKNGTTKTPDTATVINYNNFLALHISTCAESGSTSNGGIRGEYWYEVIK
jgi:hypothetical protein